MRRRLNKVKNPCRCFGERDRPVKSSTQSNSFKKSLNEIRRRHIKFFGQLFFKKAERSFLSKKLREVFCPTFFKKVGEVLKILKKLFEKVS